MIPFEGGTSIPNTSSKFEDISDQIARNTIKWGISRSQIGLSRFLDVAPSV